MLRAVLQLRSTQDYCVSPFEPSALYGDRPTYVYHAAIRHPDHAAAVVGGIGIVFDSAPQFTAMLRDALPARAGAFGLFVDRAGQVIASTDPATAPGSKLMLLNTDGLFAKVQRIDPVKGAALVD